MSQINDFLKCHQAAGEKIAALMDEAAPAERLGSAEYQDWRKVFVEALDFDERTMLLKECGFVYQAETGWVEV